MILPQNPHPARARPGLSVRLSWALLAGAAGVFAQGEDLVGTAEFQYIETLVFARPAGLAGAYTAAAQGSDAIGYNPAGVAKADAGRMLSGTFRYHMLEIASGNAAYAFPGADSNMSYAFSAAFINYGRIDELDEDGNATGIKYMPSSFNPSFTAARRVSDRLRVGATLRGFSEYLGDFTESQLGWGWGVDLGMQYQPAARNVGFGVALLNVGRKERSQLIGKDAGGLLPISLKAGFFYSAPEMPKAKLLADGEVPLHGSPRASGAIEYAYSPSFILRMGSRVQMSELAHYYNSLTDAETSTWQGGNALKLTAGFTFVSDGYALDYAAQYWDGLSWVHALTLKYAVL
ncbi:MAG: hypothetical protein JF616_00455 [Fibrobacteres bacterium]|nr:hypothetical protein [Fibrobacterota bacterium]